MSKSDIRGLYQTISRSDRISKRLNSLGVFCKVNRHLDKVTNTSWCWGGHLKDGTCHYTNRVEFSGNTFPVKDLLKSKGFRWDAEAKCWWKARSKDESYTELSVEIIRELGGFEGRKAA